jgi:hypothetical protein
MARRTPVIETKERQQCKAAADQLMHGLFQLDRSISQAAYFLPAFQIRTLTASVANLRSRLQAAQQKQLPHLPFAFSDPDVIVIVDDPLQQVCLPQMPRNSCMFF